MFRTRASRFALAVGGALLSALLVIPAWGDDEPPMTAPRTPPQLFAPPLFAVAGQSRDVAALVTGRPGAVNLLVRGGDSDLTVPMQRTEDVMYVGTIPGDGVRTSELTYSVAASYGDVTNTSETGHLVVLESVRSSTPKFLATAGTTLATFRLGSKDDQLGVRGGKESALELPPSFTVDEQHGRISILDAARSRLVTTDMKGRVQKKTRLSDGTPTASDIVLGSDGTTLVLDQDRDDVIEISKHGQRRFSSVGVATKSRGARLAFDAKSSTLFASDATQGRYVPLVTKGRTATKQERRAQAADGVPTALGALAAEVSANSVTFGLDGGHGTGFRVNFADQVLDATEVVVDGTGLITGLVGVYKQDEAKAALYLVRVDPNSGESTAVSVGVSLPGDVVRRLTATSSGVVLMEGTDTSISLVRFGGRSEGEGR